MFVVTVAFHDEPSTPLTQAMRREEADAALETLRAALGSGDARDEGWLVADAEDGFTAGRLSLVATFRVEPVLGVVMGRESARTVAGAAAPLGTTTPPPSDAAC